MADLVADGLCKQIGVPPYMVRQYGDLSMLWPVGLSRIGGIGFQYEGGVITVTGTANGVLVDFDRPMYYDGSYTQTPALSPFELSPAPVLVNSSRRLSIGIIGTPVPDPPSSPIGSATNDPAPDSPQGGAVASDPAPPAPAGGAWKIEIPV